VVTRWQITKAVRLSNLAATARLIMLVLADVADVGTAEIPSRRTPSLSVLAGETGLDRSTVKRHLKELEESGWVVRLRPDARAQHEGERTRYRLTLPSDVAAPEVGAQGAPGAGDAHGVGAQGAGVGAQEHLGGRAVRHQKKDVVDKEQIEPSSSTKPPAADVAIPERDDVEQVCRHLADRIEENGSKRPTITRRWRDAARLLIDKDGRTAEQIIRAIDWCQDDEFWRANILSMPKLRDQYERLRLAAARPNGRASPKPSTTDQRVAAARAAGREVQAMLDGRPK